MLTLALISVVAQIAVHAPPQNGLTTAAVVISPADSIRILRSGRSAQAAFESFRRRHLPVGPRGGGAGGGCDMHIGRYCYWRGNENDEPPPPPEAPSITVRRAALLQRLRRAADSLPGDEWIAGQRVRYLVEAGLADNAWTFATMDCAADRWWCLTLAGYAAHAAQRFPAADSAFGLSLAAMDPEQRCEWLDLSDLLDGELERRFTNLACADRVRLARRLLVAGAPLYSVTMTDRFTEHLSRLTRDRMARQSAAPDGERWGDDVQELGVRYGWPRWYSRSMPPPGSLLDAAITGHDDGMPYAFLPSLRVLEHVGQSDATDWRLEDRYAPAAYAPAYARSIHTVEHQLARFRRGDSTLVVAAWDVRDDTTLAGHALEASLVLVSLDDARDDSARCAPPAGLERWCPPRAAVTRLDSARSVGHMTATALVDSGLASLELLAREDRRAGRTRLGVPARRSLPPSNGTRSGITLSDLLLFSAPESASAPATLQVAVDRALPNLAIPASRSVGIFWEAYGVDPAGESAHLTLTVQETGVSLVRRLGQHLGLADPTSSLRIQWDEVLRPSHGVAGRGVRLDLSRLHAGRYRIELSVAARETSVIATRTVTVR